MDKALLARVDKQAWFHRYPRGMPFVLFGLGLMITLLFVYSIERSDSETRRLELDRDATALAAELQRKATENTAYLNAAASLFSVSRDVGQAEFSRFIEDMSTGHSSRGSLGMGWARWVKARDAKAFETSLQQLHAQPTLQLRGVPADPAADMAIITLLEPASEANFRALGYNMYGEPVRRRAMERARQTDGPSATARVQLVQDEGRREAPGTLIYVPVYEWIGGGSNRVRGRLKGFVYTPIRVQEFLDAAMVGFHRASASVDLYDGAVAAKNLLAMTPGVREDRDSQTRRFLFGDHQWTLVVTSTRPDGLTLASLLVLVLGTVVSLLLLALAWLVTNRAVEDRRVLEWLTRQAAIRTSLTRELNHRVKNTLANVLSIVALTRRRSNSLDDFAEGLTGRIRALSATHDLLSQRDWKDAPVRDVVISELAPYLDPDDQHAELSGPDVLLAPNDALSLGLALHELATNAAKYGALSVSTGRVRVSWHMLTDSLCELSWEESGGPPVSNPSRRGFGLELIEKIVSHELQSPVELNFAAEGVACRLRVPVRSSAEFAIRQAAAALR